MAKITELLARTKRGEAHRETSAERRQRALVLHEGPPHRSYREVGEILGVSKTRAGELICRGRRERRAQ